MANLNILVARSISILLVALVSTTVDAGRVTRNTAGHHLSDSDRVNRISSNVKHVEKSQKYWKDNAKSWLRERLNLEPNTNRAKNVIMFLGDGMSITTLAAARIYMGQKKGEYGESHQLSFEEFPVTGLSKTYCVDRQVADSACTATAYLGGVKTNYGTLGVNAKVTRGICENVDNSENHVNSIANWALEAGKEAGIVTTTRVTHASPAGAYAHTANRDWESDADFKSGENPEKCWDIAKQLIKAYPGEKFKVIMGGGRREFYPNTTSEGRRIDGVDLVKAWKSDKEAKNFTYSYVEDIDELKAVDADQTDYLLGLFHEAHMDYHLIANDSQPTLEEMTTVAIKILSKNENGYFLFVEGGRIDHGHHSNQAKFAIDETSEFSKAIAHAAKVTSPEDTLILVTSDHAHVMTMAGYPSRGNDIFSTGDLEHSLDEKPYLTLSYANGPGYRPEVGGVRYDASKDNNFTSGDPRYVYQSMLPLKDESHGGEDVAVFARGPWQHLFSGTFEQNVLPYAMAFAMCVNGETHSNHCTGLGSGAYFNSSSLLLTAFLLLLLKLNNKS